MGTELAAISKRAARSIMRWKKLITITLLNNGRSC
jgi:hypothetical protein